MQNKTITALAIVSAVGFLSGCTVRHYVVEKERVDQDLAAGNQGYLAGKVPETLTTQERLTTRSTYVTEIELPIFNKKKELGVPATQAGLTQESSVAAEAALGTETIQNESITETTPASATGTPVRLEKYTVQNGDTLEKISKKFYGTTKYWAKIYEANKDTLKGPDKIYPGKVINIPVDNLKEPAENLK
jgi:nucleoid-associated protein YgaU